MIESDREKASYIAAFVDGEGHIGCHKTSQGYWTRSVSFCNTDKQLLDAVVQYCADLGFSPVVQRHPPPKFSRWAQRWTVYIARDRAGFELFAATIPIQCDRKASALKTILASYADPEQVRFARRTGRISECEVCGAEIYACKAARDRGNGRFCSVECRAKGAQDRVTLACKQCDKPFTINASRGQKALYCSMSCAGKNKPHLPAQAARAAAIRWGKVLP